MISGGQKQVSMPLYHTPKIVSSAEPGDCRDGQGGGGGRFELVGVAGNPSLSLPLSATSSLTEHCVVYVTCHLPRAFASTWPGAGSRCGNFFNTFPPGVVRAWDTVFSGPTSCHLSRSLLVLVTYLTSRTKVVGKSNWRKEGFVSVSQFEGNVDHGGKVLSMRQLLTQQPQPRSEQRAAGKEVERVYKMSTPPTPWDTHFL